MTDEPTPVEEQTQQASQEMSALDPLPETYDMQSGLTVRFLPLRSVQLFAMMRILSRGSMSIMRLVKLDPDGDRETFIMQFIAIMVTAIPEADAEVFEFLETMLEPAELVRSNNLTPKQKEHNAELVRELKAELLNPDPIDLFELVEKIIRREGEDLQALGKRLAAVVRAARTAGKLPKDMFSDSSETSTQTSSSAG